VTIAYKWWESIPTTKNGEPKTNIEQTLINQARKDSAIQTPNNLYKIFSDKEQLNIERQGVQTGITPSGVLGLKSPDSSAFDVKTIGADLYSLGSQTMQEFNKSGNNLVAALNSSDMDPSFISQLSLAAKNVTKNMGSYGMGLNTLGQNL